ncbi:hypothetical protein Sjap_015700 [Stephania japonica]|uniref:Uncharacterized protein n=1 Tax=Stephania japonica TaxID=461633 RepID=A0AAP0NRL7_9MAGN
MWGKKIPTLLELCIQTAIDNVRYLGDVGETDIDLLKDILPHCTVDHLMHIENSTEAKQRDVDEAQNRAVDRFKQRFGNEVVSK